MAHTPGPWVQHAIYGCQVYGNQRLIVDTWKSRKTSAERDTDLANARLIAAAPELLAMVELAIADGGLRPINDASLRTAVAKAKGETNG